jgi:hypothetical protein
MGKELETIDIEGPNSEYLRTATAQLATRMSNGELTSEQAMAILQANIKAAAAHDSLETLDTEIAKAINDQGIFLDHVTPEAHKRLLEIGIDTSKYGPNDFQALYCAFMKKEQIEINENQPNPDVVFAGMKIREMEQAISDIGLKGKHKEEFIAALLDRYDIARISSGSYKLSPDDKPEHGLVLPPTTSKEGLVR